MQMHMQMQLQYIDIYASVNVYTQKLGTVAQA